jgi:hypothetical protein
MESSVENRKMLENTRVRRLNASSIYGPRAATVKLILRLSGDTRIRIAL